MSITKLVYGKDKYQYIDNDTLEIVKVSNFDYSSSNNDFILGKTNITFTKENEFGYTSFLINALGKSFEACIESDDDLVVTWNDRLFIKKVDNILKVPNTGYSTFVIANFWLDVRENGMLSIYRDVLSILIFDKSYNLVGLARGLTMEYCIDAKLATLHMFNSFDNICKEIVKEC